MTKKDIVERAVKLSAELEVLKEAIVKDVAKAAFAISKAWAEHPYKDAPESEDNFEDYFEIVRGDIVIERSDCHPPIEVVVPAECLYDEEKLNFALQAIHRNCEHEKKSIEESVKVSDLLELKRLLTLYPGAKDNL